MAGKQIEQIVWDGHLVVPLVAPGQADPWHLHLGDDTRWIDFVTVHDAPGGRIADEGDIYIPEAPALTQAYLQMRAISEFLRCTGYHYLYPDRLWTATFQDIVEDEDAEGGHLLVFSATATGAISLDRQHLAALEDKYAELQWLEREHAIAAHFMTNPHRELAMEHNPYHYDVEAQVVE